MTHSREAKLLLFFFVLFTLFSHWAGWNESSRLDLTRSIVEEKSLNIDQYTNNTGDRAQYQGHYYSDKAPGSSLLNTPFYWAWRGAYNRLKINETVPIAMPQETPGNVTLSLPLNNSRKKIGARFLSIIALSSLFGALMIVLIYKITRLFATEAKSLLTASIFGLGTLITPYSTVYMGIITAALLSLTSLYILLEIEKGCLQGKYYFLSGILLGLSSVVSYFSVLLFLPFLAYVYKKNRLKSLKIMAIGIFIGTTPLLLYNFLIFHNPLEVTFTHADAGVFPPARYAEVSGVKPNKWIKLGSLKQLIWLRLPRLLIFPFRGLFFYSPLLLLTLPGFYFLYRKKRLLSILLAVIFISFIIFNSYLSIWWAGGSFGSRYLAFVIPFLSIPFVYCLNFISNSKSEIIWFVLVFLVSISILITFLAFNSWTGFSMRPKGFLNTMYSFEAIDNPVCNHYIPEFLNHGPRSQMLAGLLKGNFNLRYIPPYPQQVFIGLLPSLGLLTLQIPFLSLYIVLILFLVIWGKEVKSILVKLLPSSLSDKKRLVNIALPLAAILLLLPFLRVSDTYYEHNWHLQGENETGRWMSQNGTILLYLERDATKHLNLSLGTHFKPRNLQLYLNQKSIDRYRILSSNETIIVPQVSLEQGPNRLRFYSEQGCSRPSEVLDNSSDLRCLNFVVRNVSLVSSEELREKGELIYYKNWYEPSKDNETNQTYRWSSTSPGMLLFANKSKQVLLNLSLKSYYQRRNVSFVVNNKVKGDLEVDNKSKTVLTPKFYLKEGFNKIELKTSCQNPSQVEGINDSRCLGLSLRNISVLNYKKWKSKNEMIYYRQWYKEREVPETGQSYRWAGKSPEFLFYSDGKEGIMLNLTLASYYRTRNLSLRVNGDLVKVWQLSKPSQRVLTPVVDLKQGRNEIELVTESCSRPSEVEGTDDTRCLSLKLLELNYTSYEQLLQENKTVFYGRGFYPEEKDGERSFRWMKEKGRLYFLSDSRLTRLNLRGWPYRTSKKIGLYSNGVKIENFSFNRSKSSAKTPLIISSKEFPLEIVSRQGCQVPAEFESSSDTRCVSIALSEIKRKESRNLLEAIDSGFDKNWRPLERLDEEKFRWMSQNTTLSFFNTRDENLTLEGELISYLKNRTLKVFRNGGLLGEMKVERDKKRKLDLVLIPGSNDLKFVSEEGCDKPLEVEKNSSDDRCLSFGFKKLKVEEDRGE